MTKMEWFEMKRLFCIGCTASIILSVGQLGLQAQSLEELGNLSNKLAQKNPPPFLFNASFKPPGDERPKKTQGAGARDGLRCSEAESMMRAIAPPGGYSLTTQERPELWLDLGETQAPQVLLLFRSESGQPLERILLPVQKGKSVQRFVLPSTSKALEVGRNYQWSLLVSCDGTINPSHPIFSGWVQRVAQPTKGIPESLSTTAEQVKHHAKEGYWYDAVSLLQAGLKAEKPDPQLQTLWQSLWEMLNSPPS